MVPTIGIEPKVYRLSADCSTIELHGNNFWYRETGSNRPRTDFQSVALPTELSRHTIFFGVSNEDRTHTETFTASRADHYTMDTPKKTGRGTENRTLINRLKAYYFSR